MSWFDTGTNPAKAIAGLAHIYGLPVGAPALMVARRVVTEVITWRKAGIGPIEITGADLESGSVLAAVRAKRLVPARQERAYVRDVKGLRVEDVTDEEYGEFLWRAVCEQRRAEAAQAEALRGQILNGKLPEPEEIEACLRIMLAEMERKYDVQAYRRDYMINSAAVGGKAMEPDDEQIRAFVVKQMRGEI